MKKILTLLIALGMIIAYVLSPVATMVAANGEMVIREEAVEEPIIVQEEIPLQIEPKPEEEIIVEEVVVEEEIIVEEQSVPKNLRDFKSYTNYRLLSKNSSQWKKIQTIAHSDNNGLRKVEEYYCVAMGSYYTSTLGDLFRITTETGNVFEVIITDFKADAHTDSKHQYTKRNQCIIEFYVDMKNFNSKAAFHGSVSVIDGFDGKIVAIEKIGNYFEK